MMDTDEVSVRDRIPFWNDWISQLFQGLKSDLYGDTEFDGASLTRLENHGARPEVVAARRDGVGRDRRVSASTNAAQLYVAVRGGRRD